ncbi:protein-tyrosine phosphatase family protein [Streptomyces fragilis]|uniref:Protein-tyrosine phosphatase family protein n=1 Tax=Streptomyces fragilis TaxID=67301 RepID=A0ABV2YJM2_9ACTN|nr:protein-tyrosine phosphatase family protein [Streptomyces fragilis]
MTDDWESWAEDAPGVVRLPSGRLVRGRGLRDPLPPGPAPEVGLYLQARRAPQVPWEARLLRWPDFRLPADREEARAALAEVWREAARRRVEVACSGGRGRTGTALACLAVLDGVNPAEAVTWVRRHYHPRAVETPWQRRYVRRFSAAGTAA